MSFKIKSKTLQDLLKVLSGNIIAQGIGFLTTIIVSRDLGAEQYGVFSLLLAIFIISLQVSDFGISTSYVKYLSENLSKAKEIFFTIFISKIILSFIVITILFLLSNSISMFFFHSPLYGNLIRFMSLAILFHSINSVLVANYQAKQRFKQFAFMTIFHNLLKIITVICISMLFVEKEHLVYFLYSYFFSIVGVLLFLLFTNYKNITFKNNFRFVHFIKIYKLGFWIFLASLAIMLIMRLDIMMLAKMSSKQEVGYYSAALNLAMIFPLITASLTATLLPKMDTFLKTHSVKEYIFIVLSKMKYIIILLIALEVLSPYIITLFFGEEYRKSIEIFQILVVAFSFGIIINPVSLVIYSINKAYILTILAWIQLPLNYLGNLLLIPLYQADGAAISTILIRLISGLYITIYLLKVKNAK